MKYKDIVVDMLHDLVLEADGLANANLGDNRTEAGVGATLATHAVVLALISDLREAISKVEED